MKIGDSIHNPKFKVKGFVDNITYIGNNWDSIAKEHIKLKNLKRKIIGSPYNGDPWIPIADFFQCRLLLIEKIDEQI